MRSAITQYVPTTINIIIAALFQLLRHDFKVILCCSANLLMFLINLSCSSLCFRRFCCVSDCCFTQHCFFGTLENQRLRRCHKCQQQTWCWLWKHQWGRPFRGFHIFVLWCFLCCVSEAALIPGQFVVENTPVLSLCSKCWRSLKASLGLYLNAQWDASHSGIALCFVVFCSLVWSRLQTVGI